MPYIPMKEYKKLVEAGDNLQWICSVMNNMLSSAPKHDRNPAHISHNKWCEAKMSIYRKMQKAR